MSDGIVLLASGSLLHDHAGSFLPCHFDSRIFRMLKNWVMKLMGMPTCQEIEQFAYDYLEGQLEPERVRKFERHLQGCANCKRFVDSYKKVAWPEQLAQKIPLDPDFEERVVKFLTRESN